jgi:two-component system, OmpR family, sensor histidine kinase KdpD
MLAAKTVRRLSWTLLSCLSIVAVNGVAFGLHADAFISIYLYRSILVPIAFHWGFFEAAAASILAAARLGYFTQRRFTLYMSDSQDWVALLAFETVLLVVGHLTDGTQEAR